MFLVSILRRWSRLASMTREACHASHTAKLGIGVAHQLNHLTRGLLLRLIVLLELVFYMAVRAIDAKRRFEREHDLRQSV